METDTVVLPTPRSGDEERAQTIAQRMTREKALLVEQLRKVPIVQAACEKVKVSRASFYNWKRDDPDFAKQVDDAIGDGTLFMNDMAESQLLTAIREGNLGAITYWLKHRHAAYSNRMEVTTKIKRDEGLTPEQEQAVEEALRLTSFEEPPSFNSTTSPSTHGHSISSESSGSPVAGSAEHPAPREDSGGATQAGI